MQSFSVDRIALSGKSTLCGWKPGVLQSLMDSGLNLKQAQIQAKKDGYLLSVSEVSNLVVATGKGLVADLLHDNESAGLTYHAIGTSSTAPVAGDTELGAEATRKAFTLRGRISNVLSLSVFYAKTECSYNIAEAGIFGGSLATVTLNSGTLFSHYLQAENNSGGIKDLTFDYDLTIG